MTSKKKRLPIILCAGEHGRCLLFGYADGEPVPGQPVRLTDARMILSYPSGGTFGLAASGPPSGSRVTDPVPVTVETRWQEWLAVTPQAEAAFAALVRTT